MPWISDLHNAPTAAERRRYIVLAAPVIDAEDHWLGGIVVQLSWAWAENLKRELDHATHPGGLVETFIVNREGRVLLGPVAAVGSLWSDLEEDTQYVQAQSAGHGFGDFAGLGWTVWIREILPPHPKISESGAAALSARRSPEGADLS